MEALVYNQEGKEAGKFTLPASIFGLPWNGDLVHQVITSMQSNARENNAHSKGRGEVRGGGKKPWKQKGTGRARHGSSRSPIWRGGGVTHGPSNERNYDKKVNKKMKLKALYTALSQKARDGEVVLVDTFKFAAPKTREAAQSLAKLSSVKGLEKLAYRAGSRTLLALPEASQAIYKSFRNIPGVMVQEVRNLNPELVLTYQHLLIANPEVSLALLSARAKQAGEEGKAEKVVKTAKAVSKKPVAKPASKKPVKKAAK